MTPARAYLASPPVSRFSMRLLLVMTCLWIGVMNCPAPLIYRPGEGWTYEAVGAEITDAAGAYAADIVLKVRCPQDSEMSLARSGSVLMGMLNPFDAEGLQRIAAAGLTR